ncbi:YtxH domain-containing protein [Enterococcus sp. BWB1-3]|uniref:YtxH domain-containing protein n=1 Tax=unclassified Enterococcus TaxID=2608891 RepID=UPI0019203C92|nr:MULTISPECIES: YtxH domain-containing protein [unclassified Enterococcus]MBL1228712.1 YtxH domain-containing protein [Enterococcus sp. BWB1-3]MCB5952784.1 YtxH domain-containing protein [Enterococcus sp. BWT-B8]MCB5953702.1 YtxH domain-containing protein [Enterococcus sp. CWB-B31]
MKGFIKGLLFGSVVGGIGGLFMAPRSGKETKQKIIDEIDDWKYLHDDFNEKLATFKTNLADFQETAETVIPPFVKGINKDITNFNFQAKPRLEKIQEQLTKIQNELPEMPELEEKKEQE